MTTRMTQPCSAWERVPPTNWQRAQESLLLSGLVLTNPWRMVMTLPPPCPRWNSRKIRSLPLPLPLQWKMLPMPPLLLQTRRSAVRN